MYKNRNDLRPKKSLIKNLNFMKAIILAMSMFLAVNISFAASQDDKVATETTTEKPAGEKKACCAKKQEKKACCAKNEDKKACCANKTAEEKAACAKTHGHKDCPADKKAKKGKE